MSLLYVSVVLMVLCEARCSWKEDIHGGRRNVLVLVWCSVQLQSGERGGWLFIWKCVQGTAAGISVKGIIGSNGSVSFSLRCLSSWSISSYLCNRPRSAQKAIWGCAYQFLLFVWSLIEKVVTKTSDPLQKIENRSVSGSHGPRSASCSTANGYSESCMHTVHGACRWRDCHLRSMSMLDALHLSCSLQSFKDDSALRSPTVALNSTKLQEAVATLTATVQSGSLVKSGVCNAAVT